MRRQAAPGCKSTQVCVCFFAKNASCLGSCTPLPYCRKSRAIVNSYRCANLNSKSELTRSRPYKGKHAHS